MRRAVLLAVLVAACGSDPTEDLAARAERRKEAHLLVGRITEREVFERLLELGEVEPLREACLTSTSLDVRGAALVALAHLGTPAPEGVDAAGEPELWSLYVAAADRVRAEKPRGPYAMVTAVESRRERGAQALPLLERIEEDGVFERIVEIGEAWPVARFTRRQEPGRPRHLATAALGRLEGPLARDRLLELLVEDTGDPYTDGVTHIYAAGGLTLRKDPGTAVDLLLALSSVNPNDNVAALAREGTPGNYYPVDAQVCDALLAMGLWDVEEDLVEQMKRRAWIRVLIDAHAVLRRHTGLALPFRYNGSYADRNADAEAWRARLRETRAGRRARRPFDASNPRFREGVARMIAWVGGMKVNDRYIAEKVLVLLGHEALPFLVDALRSDNPVAQREAAVVMGRIGDAAAAPALREALGLEDDDARASAVDALRLVGDREAHGIVVPRLRDTDPEVRTAAARYLETLGGEADLPVLREGLEGEKSPATVLALLCALVSHGAADADAPLLERFVEGELLERMAALAALRRAAPGWSADAAAPREDRVRAAEGFRRES